MVRKVLFAAPLLALFAAPSPGQPPANHPRLRAALHELREARAHLNDARDAWPPGHKEQAQRAIEDAMSTVQTMLAVKDVNTFRGVDRNPDYYARFRDHPRLRAALADVRDARDELRANKADFGPLRERALDDLDVAAGSIVTLLRNNKQ